MTFEILMLSREPRTMLTKPDKSFYYLARSPYHKLPNVIIAQKAYLSTEMLSITKQFSRQL